MKKHIPFLKYLVAHKYYVFIECCRLGIPFRGLIHDIDKLYPTKFFKYSKRYYTNKKFEGPEWDRAKFSHLRLCDHHWQYWCITFKTKTMSVLEMNKRAAKELVADWIGAGKAGKNIPVFEWYEENKDRVVLHPRTRAYIEELLCIYKIIQERKEIEHS